MERKSTNAAVPTGTVLVTGGSGFVGSHAVEHFLANGFHVRCLLRPERLDLGWLKGTTAEIVRADLTDPSALTPFLDGIDYVVHIAGITKARRARDYTVGNVLTTKALLTAATRIGSIRKFAYVSSLTAVGPSLTGEPLTEDAPCHPVSMYGHSKLEAERAVQSASGEVPWTILRPPAVFGPRDPDILEMFQWVRRGIRPIIGSDQKTLSLAYAPELARAILDATISPRTTGETYFVSDPTVFRFSELLDYVASLIGGLSIRLRFPPPVVYTMAAFGEAAAFILRGPALLNLSKARDLLQTHWVCSPQKLQDHIGYRTRVPTLDAIRTTYEWYRSMKWL